MKIENLKAALIAAFILLTTVTFIACRKNFLFDSVENNTLVVEAQAHLAALVKSE